MSPVVSHLLAASLLSLSLVSLSCTSASGDTFEEERPEAASANPTTNAASQDPLMGGQGGAPQGTLEAQRRNFLIGQYLEQAKGLIGQNRYSEAQAALLQAKDVDPDRPDVIRLLNEVEQRLGLREGEITTYQAYRLRQLEIRIERDMSEARRLIDDADKARGEGDFASAVDKLKRVQVMVEVGRNVEWKEIPEAAERLMANTLKEQELAESEEFETTHRKVQERLRAAAIQERKRIRRLVNSLLGKGTKAFENKQYGFAKDLATEALRIDPTHGLARDLRLAADKVIRNTRMDNYASQKARAYQAHRAWTKELTIPYTDTLTAPDEEYWNRITVLRSTDSADELIRATKDEETLALEGKLRTTMIPKGTTFPEDSSYTDVIRTIRSIVTLPILISPEANSAIEDNGYTFSMVLEARISLENLLDILVRRTDNALAYVVENGAIILTTKQKSLGKPILRVHPISDLTIEITNFTGPIIRDLPSASDEDEGDPRGGGEEEEPVKFVDPSQLEELIRTHVSPGTWDGDNIAIEATPANLIVTHTPEVQAQIERFLDDLRKFSTSLVHIESKFLRVNSNFIEQIGFDFRGGAGPNSKGTEAQLDDVTNGLDDNSSRGLDNQGQGSASASPAAGIFFDDGLDGDLRARTEHFFNTPLGSLMGTTGGATIGISIIDDLQLNLIGRLVRKQENVQVVDSQMLTVLNGQRANVSVINQIAFIQDFNVEVAQAAFIADPVVNVIQDGVVLDVRPTISYDRKYITLDLQPTVAELLRPIPTFTTSLSGTTLPVTLQFPQLTVRSAATVVRVPDGGSVLIGGLNEVLNRERRAEVPWLASLPLISFFFKQEGVVEENTSLMVLVRATIFNVKEVMAQREARSERWRKARDYR